MKRIVCWLNSMLLFAACDEATVATYVPQSEEPVTSIAHLKTLCTGRSHVLTRDIRLQCVITANDKFGEFDRTLVIADKSAGIEIAVDAASLHHRYPIGEEFMLYCNGLALGDYGGKIMLGAPPQSEYCVDRISESGLARHLRRSPGGSVGREYTRRTFDEISMRDVDTYVRFDNVRFTTSGSWCDIDSVTLQAVTTERIIIDERGASFRVRTLASADYANEPLPEGKGSLCGIIDYFNGKFALRICDREVIGFGTGAVTDATHPKACLSAAQCSFPKPTR